ncbi:MAG: DNA-binding protein [Candidatus Baldrarchaeia archaeon]
MLMSIKPKYAYQILKGTKKYELRRRLTFVPYGTRVIVYASGYVKAIIGEFRAGRKYTMSLDLLWDLVKDHAGITKTEFDQYFKGCNSGVALEVLNPIMYKEPIFLEKIREALEDPKWCPPVSYCFIPENHPLARLVDKYAMEARREMSSKHLLKSRNIVRDSRR